MRTSAFLLVLAALGLTLGPAISHAKDDAGGPNRCADCGRDVASVQKTCQVACGVKKETKTTWSVECEDICPLLPGHRDRCDPCPPPPRCGHPRCVKKLVKKEYQVEVPVYKCAVKYLCAECRDGGPPPLPTATPKKPEAPKRLSAPPVPPAPPLPTAGPKA
jgi:hypothetical protein